MKKELSKEPGLRAKSLFEWWNNEHPGDRKTQRGLADSMNIETTNLNAMLNGKRTITLKSAQKIAEYFPGVKVDYIMGMTDFITDNEEFDSFYQRCIITASEKVETFTRLAASCGFTVIPAGTDCLVSTDDGTGIKTEDYFYIKRGNRKIIIYYSQIGDILDELSGFLSVRLSNLIGKKNGDEQDG